MRSAVILAAGIGTRLGSMTEKLPKCLIPFGDRTLLECTIGKLSKFGFDNIVVNATVSMTTVPNVVGEFQSSAESAITSAGLVVGTETSAYSHTVAAGKVISQSPSAGASGAIGSLVNLVISTGPIIYVDGVNGSDSGGSGAQGNPYETVWKALEMASNGDKIIILKGTYPENLTMNKAVTIEAQGGLVRIGRRVPDDMVWVHIDDPGVSGYEGFTGYMSKYETTNAQYCAYLNAALASGDIYVSDNIVYGSNGSNSGADFIDEVYLDTYAADSDSQVSYSGGVFSVRSRDGYSMANHPVVMVSWYGATAFCNYYGYRLPTEWEWQAVADYNGSYIYGCGTTIDLSKANYLDGDFANPLGLSSYPYTSPVDHYSSYGYGMNDMAGNVFEWTDSCYYGDCNRDYRVMRSGCWNYGDFSCPVAYRQANGPHSTGGIAGFRVCR